MIIVVAALEFDNQEDRDRAVALTTDVQMATRTEEAGCRDYTFSIELNNSAMLRITEKWDSMDALLAHFQAPHMAGFQELMAAYPPKSMDACFYEAEEVTPPGM